jgi:hypothetical protein
VQASAKADVSSENESPHTQLPVPVRLEGIPIATPSFLPPEALRALATRGMVGPVACVMDA